MSKDNENRELDGKVVLITGAGDGIGRATSLLCAERGATVIISSKTQKKLEALYDEFERRGLPEAVILPMDLEKATADDYQNMQEAILSEFGRLDALLCNAGWLGASSPIEHHDVELWYRVMQININAPFLLTKTCLPLLQKSDDARIIYTLDEKDTAYWGAYGVAKHATTKLMKMVALENEGMKVCGFDPVAAKTGFRTRAYPGEDASALPSAEEIGLKIIALLCGDIEQGAVYRPDETDT